MNANKSSIKGCLGSVEIVIKRFIFLYTIYWEILVAILIWRFGDSEVSCQIKSCQ